MSTMPSAQPYLALTGGTVAGPVTVTGLLTTQAGMNNSGGTIASSGNVQNTGGSGYIGGSVTTNLGGVDVGFLTSGLSVKEGANGKQGTAVLVAGANTVADTSVTASSRIFLTSNLDGGAPGFVRVSARVVGTSFTITSSSGTDTSTIAYEIFEPG